MTVKATEAHRRASDSVSTDFSPHARAKPCLKTALVAPDAALSTFLKHLEERHFGNLRDHGLVRRTALRVRQAERYKEAAVFPFCRPMASPP